MWKILRKVYQLGNFCLLDTLRAIFESALSPLRQTLSYLPFSNSANRLRLMCEGKLTIAEKYQGLFQIATTVGLNSG
jgi:hypothetical protein